MVFIRADANEIIGTGHVMRCISIARAFVEYGIDVRFVTADHRGDGLISSFGFQSICMDSEWTDMEHEPIKTLIIGYHPDLILVDSYYVTENYFHFLSDMIKVAYIDDFNASTWKIDYLINYNIYGNLLDYSSYKDSDTKLLLGPQFAPLRKEFKNVSLHKIKNVTDIMVSAGGADPEGITEKLIEEVCPQWPNVKFHFVVGLLNPRLEIIQSLAKDNTILHINEKNMSGLMQACDVAVAAAGTTLYEICAMGIPTITYTLADNQLTASEQFAKQEIMLSVGDCRGDREFIERLKYTLNSLVNNISLRFEMSQRMQKLVDGYGAERIVEELF